MGRGPSADRPDNPPSATTANSGGAKKWTKVTVVVALLALAALVAIIVQAGSHVRHFIFFNSDESDGFQIAALKCDDGESVVLPECRESIDGYTFAGWSLGDKTYQPGDSYTPSGDTVFIAQWETRVLHINFDGNGADSGSMDSVECEYGKEVTLPKCAYVRKGYAFGAWECNGKRYDPDDSARVTEDTLFNAIWERDIAASLNVEEFFQATDNDGELFGALIIRNKSPENLWIDVDFQFLDAEGKEKAKSYGSSGGLVAPGEVAMIPALADYASEGDASSAASIAYELSVDENANKGMSPLSKMVSVAETSCTDYASTVEVTNTGTEEANVGAVVLLAKDSYEGFRSYQRSWAPWNRGRASP